MHIDDMTTHDLEQIVRIHESSQFDYKMPDLSSPLFIVKQVCRDGGRVLGAYGLRVQAETYLWLDPEMPLRLKYEVILGLSRSLALEAWRVGVDCAVAWLPPNIPPSFCRLLGHLGWSSDRKGWQSWSKEIT